MQKLLFSDTFLIFFIPSFIAAFVISFAVSVYYLLKYSIIFMWHLLTYMCRLWILNYHQVLLTLFLFVVFLVFFSTIFKILSFIIFLAFFGNENGNNGLIIATTIYILFQIFSIWNYSYVHNKMKGMPEKNWKKAFRRPKGKYMYPQD